MIDIGFSWSSPPCVQRYQQQASDFALADGTDFTNISKSVIEILLRKCAYQYGGTKDQPEFQVLSEYIGISSSYGKMYSLAR